MTSPTPTRRQQIAQALFPQLAVIGKALASPQRLMLLDLLCQGPRSVEGLSEQAGMSVANTSQHLQQLRGARLVETERQGQRIVYRLASDQVGEFYVQFRSLAASRLADLDRVMRELVRPGGPVDTVGILARMKNGEVTLLDVRPEEEYAAGHLPGALCIPVEELPRRVREIPRDKDVVAYCRGPYCTMAEEAVEVLQRNGLRAQALDLGPVELRVKHLRLERGLPSAREDRAARGATGTNMKTSARKTSTAKTLASKTPASKTPASKTPTTPKTSSSTSRTTSTRRK